MNSLGRMYPVRHVLGIQQENVCLRVHGYELASFGFFPFTSCNMALREMVALWRRSQDLASIEESTGRNVYILGLVGDL